MLDKQEYRNSPPYYADQQQQQQQAYGQPAPNQQIEYQPSHHAHVHGAAPAHAHVYSEGGKETEWETSLCSCSPCGSCLLAWCLPCILLGQTSERIRDPSMQSADMLNSDCLIHGGVTCFTGCGWM